MLKLFRKRGETIHIGNDIKIVILDNDGQTVNVGIDAPRSMEIRRGELRADRDVFDDHSVRRLITELGERLNRIESAAV
ncbi:TPA: carbon storage regulator [Legionella pneumophila]|nr:carbon storage regulator [Legionella pneumophila]